MPGPWARAQIRAGLSSGEVVIRSSGRDLQMEKVLARSLDDRHPARAAHLDGDIVEGRCLLPVQQDILEFGTTNGRDERGFTGVT